MSTATRPVIATREQWRAKRVELLAKEKALSHVRDELSRERRELPWVPVEEEYVFQTTEGDRTLPELFGLRTQLLVYHFMFGPDWDEGCPSCSFWMDSFDGTQVHLAHRDVELVVVSRAPLERLQAYRERMGWEFRWVSSVGTRFNFDYGVSFTEDERRDGAEYNFAFTAHPGDELPGVSVFAKDAAGAVFHTYSAYSRGLDVLNACYQLLDLVPKGRDEADLPHSAAWLRRRDAYDD
jgi:predicted dithiol-disulfide oxidoreductase (DUF899 family)